MCISEQLQYLRPGISIAPARRRQRRESSQRGLHASAPGEPLAVREQGDRAVHEALDAAQTPRAGADAQQGTVQVMGGEWGRLPRGQHMAPLVRLG